MDRMDAISHYTQRLLDGYENKSEGANSETSDATVRSGIAVQDMFGNQEVDTHKNP